MLVAINTVLFLNLQILQFSALTTILILLEAALAGDLMLNKQWEQVKLSYISKGQNKSDYSTAQRIACVHDF